MAEEKKKKKKKKHRFFWFIIKLQILLMILVVGAFGYYYYGGYADEVQALRTEAVSLARSSTDSTFVPGRTSTLYDSKGIIISELKGDKDADYVKYEDIPPYFTAAMVSIEDKKFYSHNGVDYKALIRAAKSIIQNRRLSQGGSTITMQLARNIYLDTGKSWQRKVEEIFIALEFEKMYSKNQIMEYYLNNIYFSNGYYGIDAASHGYFDCNLDQLSLSQIAFLCAIPNSPSYYDPLVNLDNTIARRDRILKNMYEDNKIDIATYESAVKETITLNVPQEKQVLKHNSVDTYAYMCATKALMQRGGFVFKYYFESEEEEKTYDEEYDDLYAYYQKKLYSEGYKIYTSIDAELQDQLQASVDDALSKFEAKNEEGVYEVQGAAVTINNETGLVSAIVGSRSQDFSGYTLNRAYQSHRQPGSSIKPLIVYTPYFEQGHNPEEKVKDEDIEGGPDGLGLGKITIKNAVAKSVNSIAWKLYEKVTPDAGLQYLKNMNFSNIVQNDYVMATSLGGFTTGVSPLEMASAYATIENDGLYRNPTCIISIVDSDQNIIYSNEQVDTVIYTETASRMMIDCMQEVMNSGTGKSLKLSNMPCAGKTGTTNSQKDGWFCGFTRYYTTAVWVGADIPKKIDDLKGNSYPGQIWKSFMEKAHENLRPMEFLPYAKLSDEFVEKNEKDKKKQEEDQEDQEDQVQDLEDNQDAGGDNAADVDDADHEDDAGADNDGGAADAIPPDENQIPISPDEGGESPEGQ